jgi:hypothetical protein
VGKGQVYGTLTCDSQKFKEPFMTQNHGSQRKKRVQRTCQITYSELPLLWQLFDETCWFFEIFQKPKTNKKKFLQKPGTGGGYQG